MCIFSQLHQPRSACDTWSAWSPELYRNRWQAGNKKKGRAGSGRIWGPLIGDNICSERSKLLICLHVKQINVWTSRVPQPSGRQIDIWKNAAWYFGREITSCHSSDNEVSKEQRERVAKKQKGLTNWRTMQQSLIYGGMALQRVACSFVSFPLWHTLVHLAAEPREREGWGKWHFKQCAFVALQHPPSHGCMHEHGLKRTNTFFRLPFSRKITF